MFTTAAIYPFRLTPPTKGATVGIPPTPKGVVQTPGGSSLGKAVNTNTLKKRKGRDDKQITTPTVYVITDQVLEPGTHRTKGA